MEYYAVDMVFSNVRSFIDSVAEYKTSATKKRECALYWLPITTMSPGHWRRGLTSEEMAVFGMTVCELKNDIL